MGNQQDSLLGPGKNPSPTGVGTEPPAHRALGAKGPTYLHGDGAYEEQMRLLDAERLRALNHYAVVLDRRAMRAKRALKEKVGTGAASVHRADKRRPVGSPAGYSMTPEKNTGGPGKPNSGWEVLGEIDMGPLLEPARLVASTAKVPQGNFEGANLNPEVIARRLETRQIERAKREYEAAVKAVVALDRQQSEDRAKDFLKTGAISQALGCGYTYSENLIKEAQSVMEQHAKRTLDLHGQNPVDPSDDSFGGLAKELVNSLADIQLLTGEEDNPVARKLEEALSHHAKLGSLFVQPSAPAEPSGPGHATVLYKKPPERSGSETTHTVVKGDTLSLLAQRYYGDMHAWPRIYEANRAAIGDNPHLIMPGLDLQIPTSK